MSNKIDDRLFEKGAKQVERLSEDYELTTSLNPDQLVGKILYDLERRFERTPVLEVAALVKLAELCPSTIAYLQEQYHEWKLHHGEIVLSLSERYFEAFKRLDPSLGQRAIGPGMMTDRFVVLN